MANFSTVVFHSPLSNYIQLDKIGQYEIRQAAEQ